jgi:hypothetical protein
MEAEISPPLPKIIMQCIRKVAVHLYCLLEGHIQQEKHIPQLKEPK